MELQIPETFTKILQADDTLHGAVMLSFAEFEPWLRLSGTPFFPEYTDHGPKHLTETIATAFAIVRDEAWPIVTPGDIAALVLSILLHDSAMHISDDGFISLVATGNKRSTIAGFDDKPWPILWLEFLGEASRFDARKLHSLFGDTEPTHNPGLELKIWTTRDRLLIGEFIRRHHARLAHEIALWGVPAPTDKPLRLKEIPEELADIVGVIARSHGQPIRSCLEYLKRYDVREFKGIHAVFLMTLVRVSDYLQIHSERAPEQILRIRRLRSPISQGEWKTHEAIRDIRNTHEDPEAIFVDASPKDVKTYLKLKRLLAGIQEEMDGSWAALGEVYGRYDGLKQLGLKLRRVRSNLDAEGAFARFVPYVPCEAKFEAADADLLSLLIRPLYGDHPEIGIRELIQNAVDACHELEDYRRQRPNLPHLILTTQLGGRAVSLQDVVVSLEEDKKKGTGWLEVSDGGIGMTADTVRNYFLKAGASFRRSDAWRQMHEAHPGKSRVLRSGRFGIGVLASFLLGNEVEVSTRHIDSPLEDGIGFRATIDSNEIELMRTPRPAGTTIRIKISEKKVWTALTKSTHPWQTGPSEGLLSWDWYCLSHPRVNRIVNLVGKSEALPQRFTLPDPKSSLPDSWHRISHPDYSDIQWTYENSPLLVCNGIRVLERRDRSWYYYRQDDIANLWERPYAALSCPNVVAFDPDGHLPLLLQRNGLATTRYPFHEELLADVVKDMLAFILVNAPQGSMVDPLYSDAYQDWYPGFARMQYKVLPFFSLSDGTSFLDPWNLKTANPNRALVIPSLRSLAVLNRSDLNSPSCVFGLDARIGVQDQRGWFRSAMGNTNDSAFGPVSTMKRIGGRMLVTKKTYKELKQPGLIAKFYWSGIKEEFSANDWVLLKTGPCPDDCLDFNKLATETSDGIDGLTECYFASDDPVEAEPSPIAKGWKEIIGRPTIPFDMDTRRKELKEAFDHLRNYVAVHEKLKTKRKKLPD
jgi:histidine kinase/DNA gyrase B/HSP90-like ATPase